MAIQINLAPKLLFEKKRKLLAWSDSLLTNLVVEKKVCTPNYSPEITAMELTEICCRAVSVIANNSINYALFTLITLASSKLNLNIKI